jgi:hypothetical protein
MSMSAQESEEVREHQKRVRHSNVEAQAWWDPVFEKLGTRAPPPIEGADHWQYRADMAVGAKRNLPATHPLARELQLRRLAREPDKTAFRNFEKQIHEALSAYAVSNDSAPKNQLREVVDIDANGMKLHKFLGDRSFVHDFTQPARRVISFLTSQGPMDASGRFLRR